MILRTRVPDPALARRAGQQSGFSLIIVFLLIILMVGVAATAMMSSKTDLQISGVDRESALAFYAAESGVAFAKDWLASKSATAGASAWNSTLQTADVHLCTGAPSAYYPGVIPNPCPSGPVSPVNGHCYVDGAPAYRETFTFCIHNNVLDPQYSQFGNGNTVDGDGVIAIEAYGYGPNGATARVTAEVSATAPTAIKPPQYTQKDSNQDHTKMTLP